MKQVIPIPDEEGFLAYMAAMNLSRDYLVSIISSLRRIIQETGGIPTDLNKFSDEYLYPGKFNRNKRISYRVAIRRYREYRKAKFGEEFIDT